MQSLHVAQDNEDDIILSVNFSPTNPCELAFTVNTGAVGVVDFSGSKSSGGNDGDGELLWPVHSLEAWTCEYTLDGQGLYTGGDDSVITFRDLRMGENGEVWRDRKTHGAGVTAVLSSPEMEARGEVVSGSYDEVMRVWDVRSGKRRTVVDEVSVGGGVWRVGQMGDGKWVVSGMQAGPKIVERRGEGLEVVMSWEEMNLNYGCAWVKERPKSVVWCSFYDKVVCVDEITA